MKALIVGAGGQLGRALAASVPEGVDLCCCARSDLDVANVEEVAAKVAAMKPDLIFNASAFTAVDKAESAPAQAEAVNALAPGHLAAAARGCGARLVHVSTDYVFDGRQGHPYAPDTPANPLSLYGRTKLAGEQAAGPDALVVRTAWVHSALGDNFVRRMLELMQEREALKVVADQVSTPTCALGLASALWRLAGEGIAGVLHHTDSGVASRYDFAVAIHDLALELGLLERPVAIAPVPASAFPAPAARPAYSVLDCSRTAALLGGPAPHWRHNLRRTLERLGAHG